MGLSRLLADNFLINYIRIRFKINLFNCQQCMGFWAGIICGWFFIGWKVELFLLGCCGSLLANFTELLINYIEAKTIVK